MEQQKNAPVYELIGQTLTDVGAYEEVLILRFGEYELHMTCFARALHNNRILFTTQDYACWDKEDYNHNDMYLNIAEHGKTLIGQEVRSVEVSSVNDLFLVLDNDARIEIFNSNGSLHFLEEGMVAEQWFFYKPKDKTYPYYSVENTGPVREEKA